MSKFLSSISSIKTLSVLFVLIAFSVATVLLYSQWQLVEKQNKSLVAESQELRHAIQTLESEKNGLTLRIENSEKDNKAMKQVMDSFNEERQTLESNLKAIEERLQTTVNEKAYLEDVLIHKSKEIEFLKSSANAEAPLPSGDASIDSDDSATRSSIQQKDVEIQKLTEQNMLLARKLTRLYETTSNKLSEINVAKIALEETLNQAKKLIDSEWNTVDLGSISAESPSGAVATKRPKSETTRSVAKKEGRVLAINEDHGFVVVDLGKGDGIQSNSELSLKNSDGKSQGVLTVLEVRDGMSACNIKDLAPGQKIQINDLVLIR